jgi:hypothetical protein
MVNEGVAILNRRSTHMTPARFSNAVYRRNASPVQRACRWLISGQILKTNSLKQDILPTVTGTRAAFAGVLMCGTKIGSQLA